MHYIDSFSKFGKVGPYIFANHPYLVTGNIFGIGFRPEITDPQQESHAMSLDSLARYGKHLHPKSLLAGAKVFHTVRELRRNQWKSQEELREIGRSP